MVGRYIARICEMTAQIGAESRDQGRTECQLRTHTVPAPAAGHPRGCVDTDREAIDTGVDKAYPLVAWSRGCPLCPSGPSRWCRGEQAAADKCLGRRESSGPPKRSRMLAEVQEPSATSVSNG